MSQSLESCKKEHDHDVFDQAYIPERLIDMSFELPRLILRKDILQSGHSSGLEYAALSYCWGSGESQITTTTATLCDRQAGISEHEMPPVLRDAIKVSRGLGFSFLWVDALCIFQDNKADWEQQCGEMHNIYGSAQVTICVANARSCNEGFLKQTTPRVRLPFQSVRAPDVASSFLVQYTGRLSDEWELQNGPSLESGDLLYKDTKESHWGKRGWVFQEEILSIRRLVFGRFNVHFDCGGIQHTRGTGVPSKVFTPNISKSLAEEDPSVLYFNWSRTIFGPYSGYDASTFSRVSDVLPALSGLARLFRNRLKSVYYAGHWERDLYKSLSWMGFPRYGQPLQPDGLVIPSWSRLAKGYTETYAYSYSSSWFNVRSEIKISKGRIVTVGDNPFGALKECSLWIRGYTLALNRKEVQISSNPSVRDLGQWHLVLHGRCFGHLGFDWRAGLPNPKEKCPSAEDVKFLKILLLGSFIEDSTSKEVSEDGESEWSTIPDGQDSELEDEIGEESASQEQSEGFPERSHCQDPAPNEEASTRDDDSKHRQSQMPIRQGYGLIISPTGNDGEFCRVGLVFAPNSCMPRGDGNLEALHGLAQMETVHLV